MVKRLFQGLGKEKKKIELDLRSALRRRERLGSVDILTILQKEIHRVEQNLQRIDEFYRKNLRFSDRLSDRIAEVGGSWAFIISFLVFLFAWMILNSLILAGKAFDHYPYILLNLILSTLAAIQAPIILMSQNRASKRDQARMEIDLEKDLRDLHVDEASHRILLDLRRDLEAVKKKIGVK
ncbi:DUF1003 domain-containing protein [Candidatus Woesearchaeota archaeon]|nr:DUF1003 domain-containing protein [Candidatus Woesearchaeota archaeon]